MIKHLIIVLATYVLISDTRKRCTSVRRTTTQHIKTTRFDDFFENCGSVSIDVRLSVCCSGQIFPRVPNAECCYDYSGNATVYNLKKELCCSGNVVRRLRNYACCDRSAYDTDRQICCGREVFYLNQLGGGNDTQVAACCNNAYGNNAYDMKTQTCCNGMVRYKQNNGECCGVYHINTMNLICCMGPKARTRNAKCCGWRVYDYTKQKCVGSNIINRRN